ncbi:CPBP family intramembrane metalloprotease [Oscillatoria sp. FACHB-1406]|nr:type II CAAX endopeptidase family protein [Oscillatoria sp. FACHB-1406]MBD2579232.1 CPBP family intramembrane metalloprotease [Oscillatoria sp. FACHB-1406]
MAVASVKVMAFFAAWLILWLPVAIPLAKTLKWNPSQPLTGQQKLPILASLYAIAPLILWGATRVLGSSFFDYGFKLQPELFISLSLGIIASILGLSIAFFGETLAGWVRWQSNNFKRLLSLSVPILALGLWIGGTEELIFRGFLLTELERGSGIAIAAVLSSSIFALSHLLWDRQQTLPQLPGLFLMGLVLAVARWVDGGSLGLAWGLHAGWIWGLTILDSAELMSYSEESPAWGVGIGKQPLAGLAGILCVLVTGVSLWAFAPVLAR